MEFVWEFESPLTPTGEMFVVALGVTAFYLVAVCLQIRRNRRGA